MRPVLLIALVAAGLAGAGCNAILGNDDHRLAPPAQGGVDASTCDAETGGDSGANLDGPGAPPDGRPGAPPDGSSLDAAAANEAGNPGGSAPPTSGAIYTVGRVPDDAGAHVLPDGAAVTLTDDGFEFGETLCNGAICVTGGITP
jgi:hypothetical protein